MSEKILLKTFIFSLLFLSSFFLFANPVDPGRTQQAMLNSQVFASRKLFCTQPVSEEELKALEWGEVNGRPFRFKIKELAPHTTFNIYNFTLDFFRNPTFFCSGFVNESGVACFLKDDLNLEFENIYFDIWIDPPSLPGEPIYFLLVTDESPSLATYLAATTIPHPIETFGEEGHHLWLEIMSFDQESYAILGEHFTPGEAIYLSVIEDDDIASYLLWASEEGTFSFFLRKEYMAGTPGEIQCRSQESDVNLVIHYSWDFSQKRDF